MKLEKSTAMKLSPPWVSYHKMVLALFAEDSEVQIRNIYSDDGKNYTYVVLCNTSEKAVALKTLLKTGEFGDITVTAIVYGPEENAEVAPSEEVNSELIEDAFFNNPIFVEMVSGGGPFEVFYCVFARRVIQFWSDNLNDLWGNTSTLAENIAREVFVDVGNVMFCTSPFED